MKAQFWSFDIVFAIIIFIFAIVILTFVWINVSGSYSLSYGANLQHMQAQLQSLGTQILSTGSPPNWNNAMQLGSPGTWANLSIGLGNGTSGALSQSKVGALLNMSKANYQDVKPALGVSYDYYITITGGGNNDAIGINPAGENITTDQATMIPAVLNGQPVQVQIQLWSNSSLGIE